MDRQEKLYRQYDQMSAYEKRAVGQGFITIAGIDEAGRGPLAGPVVAAACVLDPDHPVFGLNDSKKLTPAARNKLYGQILKTAPAWQVGLSGPDEIDRINILQATCEAMRKAVTGLAAEPDLLLVDTVKLKGFRMPVWPIVHGDALSVSIAAASILAKVTRDRLMDEFDKIYPGYGFASHKGYGTRQHYEALFRLGPCPIHRMTFLRSVRDQLASSGFPADPPCREGDG